MAKILMVIAPKNFRDDELSIPKKFFESKKLQVDVATTTKDKVVGMLGTVLKPDLLIKDVILDEYTVVVFVGGIGVDDQRLYDNPEYTQLAKKSFLKAKVVSAICVAPKILAGAGLLKSKKVACFSSAMPYVKEKGGIVQNQDVVQDGMIITASGPQAAQKFAETIYAMISR